MAEEDSFIGKQIGNYQIIAEIDSGTFGTVCKAQHTILEKRIVAIKLLHARFRSQEERDQFFLEARILEELKHRHILPVLDVGISNHIPYIVIEYAPNGSLRDLIDHFSPDPLPMEKAIAILIQIGQALDYAHQQDVVHLDLKPANILFNAKDEALLADFGIALTLETTKHADVRGTPAYMAPEQFRGEVSKKSDQYALGCIAYELMTGRKAFVAPDFYPMAFKHLNEYPPAPTQFNPLVSVHVEQAIFKSILKDRSKRHKDVLTFITALEKTSQQWLEEGEALRRLGRYEEALAAYAQAIRLDPRNVSAYHSKLDLLFGTWRYEEALVVCEQVILLEPHNVGIHRRKASILHNLGRYEESLVASERIISLDPDDMLDYYNKADLLKTLKRYEEALATYKHIIQQDPNDFVAYSEMGNVFGKIGRYEEALIAYDQSIRLEPDNAVAHRGKGTVLEHLGRLKEAQQFYKRAKRLGYWT